MNQNDPMTPTTLSPAAQLIWDAFNDVFERVGVFEDYGDALAAVLRAAADRIAEEVPPGQSVWGEGYVEGVIFFRDELLAIAAELKGDSKENERPDRLIAGDVWEFEWEVQVKGKRKPQPQKLKFKVIGYHPYQCAWQLKSLDGEHYCYLLEFAPQYEDMTYIGHLDQDELEGSL